MAALSHADIERELGKNIYLYPLNPNNIKGASINLTASDQAWSVKDKKTIVKDGCITIGPHDTALIETAECIYVTGKICGTYHSKVGIVSKGIGHIGTTLDPLWIGPSIVALHNNMNEPFCLNVGDSFVSIMLYYTRTKSTKENENNAGQPTVLLSYPPGVVDVAWFSVPWRIKKKDLKEKMMESREYQELKKSQWSLAKIALSGPAFIAYFLLIALGYIWCVANKPWGIFSGMVVKDTISQISLVVLTFFATMITIRYKK